MSDNATVVNAIAKYYDFAINGFSKLMFLHCDGWKYFLLIKRIVETMLDSNIGII
jgi:hypothetical protein